MTIQKCNDFVKTVTLGTYNTMQDYPCIITSSFVAGITTLYFEKIEESRNDLFETYAMCPLNSLNTYIPLVYVACTFSTFAFFGGLRAALLYRPEGARN
jgi:cellobiose-specific phosphotransferase system component IIC